LTILAAAALLGSFGTAGTLNGLWSSPDARAHSLEGLKLAVGMPYGSHHHARSVQWSAVSGQPFAMTGAVPMASQTRQQAACPTKAPHVGLVADLFQKPVVRATPHLAMAQASHQVESLAALEPPEPPEPGTPPDVPAAPTAPASPVFAGLGAAPYGSANMKALVSQAQADANKSAKLALQAANAANAAYAIRQAQASAAIKVKIAAPLAVTPAQYEDLTQELEQAMHELDVSQELAALIQEGDFSFVVSVDDGKRTCILNQPSEDCDLLSAVDRARLREEVAKQVERAQSAVRQSQMKLGRVRLTNG